MAQKGKAGVAIGISTFGSFIGDIAGWISLVVLSPLWLRLRSTRDRRNISDGAFGRQEKVP